MGGNAIKSFGESTRLSASDYDALSLDILSILSVDESFPYQELTMPRLVQSYHDKESHGDMDILVPSLFWYFNSHDKIKEKLNAVGYVTNSTVVSYAIPLNEKLFQLDIISVESCKISIQIDSQENSSFVPLCLLILFFFYLIGILDEDNLQSYLDEPV